MNTDCWGSIINNVKFSFEEKTQRLNKLVLSFPVFVDRPEHYPCK